MNRNAQSATRTPGHCRGWVISLCLAFLLSLNALDAQAAQQIVYYHTDALGSPVAATDEAGAVIWREEYLPYGQRIYRDPATVKNDRWFTGHPHEEDVGLTYMGARWYDPVVGRFMATDPKAFSEGDPQSFNRYAYANNNPYKYVDPDGRAGVMVVTPYGPMPLPLVPLNGKPIDYTQPWFTPGTGAALMRLYIVLRYPYILNSGSKESKGKEGAAVSGSEGAPNPADFEDPNGLPTGWEWRGNGQPGSREGAYHNPETDESMHDDRTHPKGKDPHWTYTDPEGMRWDNFGNGWTPQE